MQATLYCLPLGSSCRDSFAAALQRQPEKKGALILPNSGLIEEAGRRYHLTALGMDSLATKVLNCNGKSHLRLLNRRSQELLLGQVVEELAAGGWLHYYQPLAGKKNFVKDMVSFIGQLRRSGATEEQVHQALVDWGRQGGDRRKDEDTDKIYQAYRLRLAQEGWYDLQGVYSLAVEELVREGSRLPYEELYICDFASFEPLVLDFLKALAQRVRLHIALGYEEGRKEVFAASQASFATLRGFCALGRLDDLGGGGPREAGEEGALEYLARHLFSSQALDPCNDPASEKKILLREYSSQEAECRHCLTELKELLLQGVRPGDILLCAKDLSAYSGLRALADEYGLPLQLAETAALLEQPLARFLLTALKAALPGREGVMNYFALLESRLGRFIFSVDGQALYQLRQQKYYEDLGSLKADVAAKLGQDYGQLAALEAFWQQTAGPLTLGRWKEALLQLLEALDLPRRLGRLHQEGKLGLEQIRLLLLSHRALRACLEQLARDYRDCGLGGRSYRLGEAAAIVEEALGQQQLTLAPGQKEGVACGAVAACQGQSYPYIYLLGLQEGDFPRLQRQHFYDEQERAALEGLGISLPTRVKAYGEDAYFFAQLAAQAGQRLCLSWSREGDGVPSPYVAEVQKLFPQLRAAFCPAAKKPASLGELWQQQGLNLSPYLTEEERAALAADRQRAAGDPLYLGDLQQSRGVASLPRPQHFSPSSLELYAACPFRYLGEKVWGQQLIETKEDKADPAGEGSLLHAVLAAFTQPLIDKGERLADKPLNVREEELSALLEEKSASYSQNGLAFASEKAKLAHTLRRFLRYAYREEEQWGQRPVAVEWSFGRGGRPPVRLTLASGCQVELEGRIDRIDQVDGGLYVTDYKRSRTPAPKDWKDSRDLQLPIYLLAVKQNFTEEVAGGSYLSLKELTRQGRLLFTNSSYKPIVKKKSSKAGFEADWPTFAQHFQDLIRSYIEGIYAGDYRPKPQKGCHEHCPLAGCCRWELSQSKGGEADE